MTSQPTCSVKAEYESELRRFTNNGSYEDVVNNVCTLFKLIPNEIQIQYKDDEGDWITISTQQELNVGLSLQPQNTPLRLLITKVQNAPSFIPSQEAPRALDSMEISPSGTMTFDGNINPISPEQLTKQMKAINSDIQQLKISRQEALAYKKQDPQRSQKNARLITEQIKHLKFQRKQMLVNKKFQKKQNQALRARLIQSLNKKNAFNPGEEFVEVMKFRNEGDTCWPQNISLVPVGKERDNHLLCSDPTFSVPSAESGATVEIVMNLRAPDAPGRYIAHWRLTTSDGQKFGQRASISLFVRGSPEKRKKDSPGNGNTRVNWVDMINKLESMGFSDKKKNIRLLKQYGGDINLVLEHLTTE